MKSNKTFFSIDNDNSNYNSLIDDYRRTKILYKFIYFKLDKDILFELLIQTLSKTFKISNQLSIGVKFNLKINNINTFHEIVEFDLDNRIIELEWNLDGDYYYLIFQVKKWLFSKKYSFIKCKQVITRQKTFFGIQDFIGFHLYKKSFYKNVKNIKKSLKKLQNQEIIEKK